MSHSTRMLATAFGALFAMTIALFQSAPASADPGPRDPSHQVVRGAGTELCPEDRICLYDLPDFNRANPNAEVWILWGTFPDLATAGARDRAESIYNNTNDEVSVFRHWIWSEGDRDCRTLPRYSVHRNLQWYNLENQISALSNHPVNRCDA